MLLALEEARKEVVPITRQTVSNVKRFMSLSLRNNTYGTLEFGSLPPIAFKDVVKTNFSAGKLLASGFARAGRRAALAITAAVAFYSIAVELVRESLGATLPTHHSRAGTSLLGRDATTTLAGTGRCTLFSCYPRCRPRDRLTVVKYLGRGWLRRKHVEAFVELRHSLGIDGRYRGGYLIMWLPYGREVWNDSDVDSHIVLEILIPCNESIATLILETDPFGRSLVETVKVLNGGDNGVGSIVCPNLNSHRKPCSIVGTTIEEQLECDILWGWRYWRQAVAGRGILVIFAIRMIARRCRIALCIQSNIV